MMPDEPQPPIAIRLSINTSREGKVPRDDPTYAEFNRNFRNATATIRQIAAEVCRGHAISCELHVAPGTRPWRARENFKSAQHVGVDFDSGDERSGLEFLAAQPLIAQYSSIIHTTSSHTAERPRARVIFILSEPIADPDEYEDVVHGILVSVGGNAADSAAHDAARLWFGAVNCASRVHERVLPVEVAREWAEATPRPRAAEEIPEVIPVGGRHFALTSAAGTMHNRGMSAGVIAAALRQMNEEQFEEPMPEEEIAREISGIVGGLPHWERTEPDPLEGGTREVAEGERTPEQLLAEIQARHGSNGGHGDAGGGSGEAPPGNHGGAPGSGPGAGPRRRRAKASATPDDALLCDLYLANRPQLIWAGETFRKYDPEVGIWEAMDKKVVRHDIKGVLEAARPRPRIMNGTVGSIYDMAGGARFRPAEVLDARADLIPCKNGALNYAAGELLPHDPGHLFTSALPFEYDPAAECPAFDRYLATTIPEAAGFLQEFAGYCLTTSCRYETAVWLCGPKGSGKSTFLLALQTMLGTRCGVLGLASIEASRFALNSLVGKTLVTATEQPSLYIRSSHTLNAIISGEPMRVEEKFERAYDLTPRAKIAWAMNVLPRGDSEDGLFRRVKVVPFRDRPEDQQDPAMKEAIVGEGSGILNWALTGLARLSARGRFELPETVKAATELFKRENDVPRLFIEEDCEVDAQAETTSSNLYAAYSNWCRATGHKPQSSNSVAHDWMRLGFSIRHTRDGNIWTGVKIVAERNVVGNDLR
jgi:P4 family phage/plasmid primase-like protien